jgi:bifunctional DNase/RNase
MIKMTVESVRINLQTSQRVLILKATEPERYLFIWVAHAEAYAIAIELQGTSSPRPLTHDLFINLMKACEIKVVRCVISDLVEDIFYSYIEVDMAGKLVRVDARPSDAIAIAVRARVPIYVEESVLERSGVSLDAGDLEKEIVQQQIQKDQERFQALNEESSPGIGQPIQEEDDRIQELSQEAKDVNQTFRKPNPEDRERFDTFTERAKKVLSLAQEEAKYFQHNYIGTEHLLLGLVREGEGVAAKVLSNLGVELNKVRSAVEFIIGRGDRVVLGELGLTPRAKKVIELAIDEARHLNHHYIGTEHLLLGLVREGEGIAAGVLQSLGVNLEKVRTQTIRVLNTSGAAHKEEASEQQAFELLGGRYQLQDTLGQDGIFTMYRGWDTQMDRVAAVKVLREVYSTDPKFVRRFQVEAKAASALQHPNIVQVYDYGQTDGNYFIVMELVEGTDLRRYLRSRGVLDVDRAIIIAHDVALGLGAAHRRDIVHRDVKPQNVLVGRGGSIKLTDFGIASVYKDIHAERLITTGMTLGTVQYYAPEQAQGEIVSPAADVYALGIVMYEMVTGHPPFDGESPVAVVMQHIHDMPVPPSQLNPNIPPALEEIIMRCLEKAPEMRFRDGSSLALALETLS